MLEGFSSPSFRAPPFGAETPGFFKHYETLEILNLQYEVH